MPADVFFIAGEASGDVQAALLARAMRAHRPNLSFAGAGGDAMRDAGVRVIIDSTEFAGIGPISVLLKAPAIYISYLRCIDAVRRHPPRLLVPIDSGAINLRLLGRLRRQGYGGEAVYYFPPAAWLDDAATARRTAQLATPLTPFEHQRDFYRGLGLQAEHFGHPLVSVIAPRDRRPRRPQPQIAILPGSRGEEVQRHLPVIARAARAFSDSASADLAIVAASAQRESQIGKLWTSLDGPPARLVRGPVVEAITDADVAWTASGTAVLETALREVPQIAYYVVSAAQYRIAHRRIPQIVAGHLTLPNLVCGREIVPELKQDAFTPEALVDATRGLLDDEALVSAQLAGYAELRARLGPPDALDRIALYMVDRVEGRATQAR